MGHRIGRYLPRVIGYHIDGVAQERKKVTDYSTDGTGEKLNKYIK